MAVEYHRKVIKISAWDSPNVELATRQQELGEAPTGQLVIPGVLTWDKLQERLLLWDEVLQCIGLRGDFYQGAQSLLYPPLWLNRAHSPEFLSACRNHPAEAIGIDPAEGGDKTSMTAVNRFGLKELVSRKTPNTNDIVTEAITFAQHHRVPWHMVSFDAGGGGTQHAHRMQANGMDVRIIAFGESPSLRPRRGLVRIEEKIKKKEEKYSFKNLRAEMYWALREKLDPGLNPMGFALPDEYRELRRQLAPMPLLRTEEGTFYMLPKRTKGQLPLPGMGIDISRMGARKESLYDLLGCSPDEADSLVLAIYTMDYEIRLPEATCF